MGILDKKYIVTMPNGERWAVPVRAIAENRAAYYAKDFEGDAGRSMTEDTEPYFNECEEEIEDWARNNMNWVDVMGSATLLTTGITDYQEGWLSGDVEVL